jgi:hypothetical protein
VEPAVDAPSPFGVSPVGLGPVHPLQPQPQLVSLDPTPLDDFCFQLISTGTLTNGCASHGPRFPVVRFLGRQAASGLRAARQEDRSPTTPEGATAPAGRPRVSGARSGAVANSNSSGLPYCRRRAPRRAWKTRDMGPTSQGSLPASRANEGDIPENQGGLRLPGSFPGALPPGKPPRPEVPEAPWSPERAIFHQLGWAALTG